VEFQGSVGQGQGELPLQTPTGVRDAAADGLFDRFSSALEEINNWASRTKDGSLSDLGYIPEARYGTRSRQSTATAKADAAGICGVFLPEGQTRAGKRQRDCYKPRAIIQRPCASGGGRVDTADYKWVIIDEAHNIERVAEEHFGIDINTER